MSLIRLSHFYGFCPRLLHFASKAMAKVFVFFMCFALTTTYQTRRVYNICSTHHINKVYLGLEETGVITAYNVTVRHSSLGSLSFFESCQVEIVTCPSCIVFLKFSFINLTCSCKSRCDYVWVTEPPYEDFGVPFCKLIPNITQMSDLYYKSKTRTVRISFFFAKAHSHAFTIEYNSKTNRQFFFGSLRRTPESNFSNGFISSPFFPVAYPRNIVADYVLSCIKEINFSPVDDHSCRIQLIFTDFQLAPVSVLEFYDGHHLINVIRGNAFRPPVFLTSTNTLTVRFYASGGNNAGFKAAYFFISDDSAKKMAKPATGYVDDFGGTITMNMIGSEKKLYDCIWLIKPSNTIISKTHLYLKVTTFLDFAGDAELQVRQGLTSESSVLDQLRHPVSQNFKEHVLPLKVGYYVSLRAWFSSSSRFAITYASFSYKKCFVPSQFLCHNYRCISEKLTCDGFDHCGDNSDEPDVCYREWGLEPTIGRWFIRTSNYYFPKIKEYSDFKIASVVFLVSLICLGFLLSVLTTLLYRVRTKARRERSFQQEVESIRESRDSLSNEIYLEDVVMDDPPSYEAPPNYDEIMNFSVSLITPYSVLNSNQRLRDSPISGNQEQ